MRSLLILFVIVGTGMVGGKYAENVQKGNTPKASRIRLKEKVDDGDHRYQVVIIDTQEYLLHVGPKTESMVPIHNPSRTD